MNLNTLTITFLSGLLVMGFTKNVFADNAEIPYNFTAGAPAYADEVNANFDELEAAVNSKPDVMASFGYSRTPTVRGVTITNVLVNGGAITSPVEAGSTITVALDYNIVDPGCPGCIDQIQVGFSHTAPTDCVYSGIPGVAGVSGSGSTTLTAPSTPGTYYIGVDRSQAFSCPAGWWNGAPSNTNRWIGAITVR